MSSNTTVVDKNNVWIYHERQQALLCGQHALNNLVQCPEAFGAGQLATIAQHLDGLELQVMAQNNDGGIMSPDYQRRLAEGSHHVDAQGNFSIEVLKVALQNRYGIQLPHLNKKDLMKSKTANGQVTDITDYQGFLCHKADHWFAIRNVGGRFWNMNSTLERPEVISHFKLATEIEQCGVAGYTIFCIPSGLPVAGVKPRNVIPGSVGNWHRMVDLLDGKSTTASSLIDPWANFGSGMRLDKERKASTTTAAVASTNNGMHVEDLSEEDQLQLALQMSLGDSYGNKNNNSTELMIVPVPDEPIEGTAGVVKIRFRFPNNKVIIRRFCQTDMIATVYSFALEQCSMQSTNNPNKILEMLYGYPPKDLMTSIQHTGQQSLMTISEAKLANESIQCRFR